ncbi:hypothetical protein DKT77_14490 [Meridianimarinicoccus roseus]|uniref:Surface lipoprotein assembly modifier C-terminal domain-containing protein n=2 Tax=Meridianimarinicoccus roseus TaxID=2072018 RepID=A0A2V2LF01_9RHOB|nr:hypothetical protein DKT77_14490 [Meridianimarinicoccus roseus]
MPSIGTGSAIGRWLVVMLVLLSGGVQAAPRTAQEARAVDAAFLRGLAALDGGAPRAAIPVFLGILGPHPDLVRVRLELGRAYFEDRQWSNARREFLLVLSADIPRPVRANVLAYIRAIDSRRGFDWDISLALTELRSGENYRTDTIDLNFGGIALPFTLNRTDDRELGLTFSASAGLRADLPTLSGPGIATTAFGEAFSFGDYARTPSLRDISYGLRAGLRFSAPRTTSSVAVVATRREVAAEHFEDRAGLELAAERRSPGGLSVFGSAQVLDVDNAFTDTLDGSSVFAEAGLRRSIGGRAVIGAALFGEARRADLDFESYDRVGLRVFGSVEARFGLSIRPSVTWARTHYITPNPLFIGSRDERELTGRLRVEKTDLILGDGFSPFIELEANEVQSGIDAFSYWSRGVSVGLRRVF